MPVTSLYDAGDRLLSIVGDGGANSLTIRRNSAGRMSVNGGAVPIRGGAATVFNTDLIQISGLDGNDFILLSETGGRLPNATLSGGLGNDRMTSGSGADLLFGDDGNDILFGKAGTDRLYGGADHDVLAGGPGRDFVYGEGGDDRFVWNQGDHSDLFEGGDGFDTAEVNGYSVAETFVIVSDNVRLRLDRATPYFSSLDIGTVEHLIVNAGGGNDAITATGSFAGFIQLTIDGGPGSDTIRAGDGADRILGGAGDDVVAGGEGADTTLLGNGNDLFVWNPGDGSDAVEGEAGYDAVQVNGKDGHDTFSLTSDRGRGRVRDDSSEARMSFEGVERVVFKLEGYGNDVWVDDLADSDIAHVVVSLAWQDPASTQPNQDHIFVAATLADDAIRVGAAGAAVLVTGLHAATYVYNAGYSDALVIEPLAGRDHIVVEDTAATGIYEIRLDLGERPGMIANDGDGDADQVTIEGGAGADELLVFQNYGMIEVADSDFSRFVTILNAEAADKLTVNGNGGNDGIDASRYEPGGGALEIHGGAGFDAVLGSPGDDLISGGDGDDSASLGAGDDIFVWNVGDDQDLIEGEDGTDILDFNGNDAVDEIHIFAGWGSVYVGGEGGEAILRGVEELRLDPSGGADEITVNGLFGSDVERVVIDLAAAAGGGDGAVDTIVITGSYDRDVIRVTGADGTVTVTGLAAEVQILNVEAHDFLVIDGWDGDDEIDASGLTTALRFLADGDDGNDVLIGTFGDDTLLGGPGTDALIGNGGNDSLNQDGWFIS